MLGGREAGVGAELIVVISLAPPDIDVAAVLGGLVDPKDDELPKLEIIDSVSVVFRLPCPGVIVMTDIRAPAGPPDVLVRKVAESLPS
jgi:hypothetical protein